jgi:primosomal protein N' (replication factor Y)
MFVIEVIPIAKNIGTDTLSYFTSKEIPLGALVDVPLRSKTVEAIVISVKPAASMKGDIKQATFTLKKLEKIKATEFFSKEFMEMAEESAQYFATSIGAILDVIVPDYILKSAGKLKIKNGDRATIKSDVQEKYAVQGDEEERYGTWKSLIRQEFARKRSLFFLFPTIEEAEHAFSRLEKGIEGYAFLLHGSLLKKEITDTWNKAMKEEHPIAIIATGAFLSFPRNDIDAIVIEGESSRTYKIPRRPFLDIRHCAEVLAEKKGIRLYVADNFLRLETLSRQHDGEIVEASPFKFRSLSTAEDTLVDMRTYKDQNRTSFKILSDKVESLIALNKDESEQMIILATRRGVAPSTVCGDCQNIVTCTNCSAPVVLHKTKTGNGSAEKSFFLCHRCGERRSTEEYCKVCGSWKLGVVGIGIDLVEEKIKDKFPDVTLFRIDSDTVKDDKSARAVVQKFRAKPGSILIGTEMMLQYIHGKVENSAIISLDSLFSLPDFRIQERILHMLITMRYITSKHIIVQTRKADEKVFEYGLKGNMSDFFRTSLEERKQFKYSPFSMLIKLTLEGKKDEIVKEMENAQTLLEPYEVEVFPAFTHTQRGNTVLHGLIRLPRESWPKEDLIEKIRSLSPAISVKVDPETLL